LIEVISTLCAYAVLTQSDKEAEEVIREACFIFRAFAGMNWKDEQEQKEVDTRREMVPRPLGEDEANMDVGINDGGLGLIKSNFSSVGEREEVDLRRTQQIHMSASEVWLSVPQDHPLQKHIHVFDLTHFYYLYLPILSHLTSLCCTVNLSLHRLAFNALTSLLRDYGRYFSPQCWVLVFLACVEPLLEYGRRTLVNVEDCEFVGGCLLRNSRHVSKNERMKGKGRKSYVAVETEEESRLLKEFFTRFEGPDCTSEEVEREKQRREAFHYFMVNSVDHSLGSDVRSRWLYGLKSYLALSSNIKKISSSPFYLPSLYPTAPFLYPSYEPSVKICSLWSSSALPFHGAAPFPIPWMRIEFDHVADVLVNLFVSHFDLLCYGGLWEWNELKTELPLVFEWRKGGEGEEEVGRMDVGGEGEGEGVKERTIVVGEDDDGGGDGEEGSGEGGRSDSSKVGGGSNNAAAKKKSAGDGDSIPIIYVRQAFKLNGREERFGALERAVDVGKEMEALKDYDVKLKSSSQVRDAPFF
jgi:hypothetical protein